MPWAAYSVAQWVVPKAGTTALRKVALKVVRTAALTDFYWVVTLEGHWVEHLADWKVWQKVDMTAVNWVVSLAQ